MTPETRARLKNLAKKATPGPLDNRCNDFSNTPRARWFWGEYGWVAESVQPYPEENAEFIAAANPETILELLAENERLNEELCLLRSLKEELSSYSVGVSFMSEEKPKKILEALEKME